MSSKRIFYLLLVFVIAGFGALAGFGLGAFTSYQFFNKQLSQMQTPTQNNSAAQTAQNPAEGSTTQPAAGETTQVVPAVTEPSQVLQFSSSEVDTAVTQVVEKIGPAVVTVIGVIPLTNDWLYQYDESTASGSGVIISPDGYILTNHHVIEQMNDITVVLADGTELTATVVGDDSYADLAVLKVEGAMPAVAVFGNSENLKPGETVIAIGSPLGSFKNSVTVGVVSATGRSLDTGNGYEMQDMVQTDASINPGNSGGPLLNLAGEVIGINTLIVRNGSGTTAEGLGFAVPSSLAATLSSQIIENGYFARPNLGIRWQAVNPAISARYRLPVEYGAYVLDVQNGSPAAQAGIQVNDIITCINDVCIDDANQYYNILFEYKPGDTVKVTLARGTSTLQVDVTLGESATY